MNLKELLDELIEDRNYLISEIGGTFDTEQLIGFGARLNEVNNMIYKLTEIHVQEGIRRQERMQASEQREQAIAMLNTENNKLKSDNHLLQLFIENNVSEEKQKEIFK